MELRLKLRARTTKDLDTVYRGAFEHWLDSLDEALTEEIDDFLYSRDEPVQIRGSQISVVGLPYLIAQKLHACTEVFDGQENERVHDLMDLLLARDLLQPASLVRVREACRAIFANRAKQPWPPALIVYPSWAEVYRALAKEESFPVIDVVEAAARIRSFIEEIDNANKIHSH